MARESDQPGLNLEVEGVPSNGNGHKNGNGRLPEDLVEYNGFIAVNAANPDQNFAVMKRDLIGIGAGDLKTQLRIVNRVDTARREIREAKGRFANKPSSD